MNCVGAAVSFQMWRQVGCLKKFLNWVDHSQTGFGHGFWHPTPVTTLERINFELTHSHQVFYFSLLVTRLIISRVLAWAIFKIVKLPFWCLKWSAVKLVDSTTNLVAKIPPVSAGKAKKRKKQKTRVTKRRTRSYKRLVEAEENIKQIVASKVSYFLNFSVELMLFIVSLEGFWIRL